ncbi:MAG: YidC/Oxa1 family membrane protein insertase [Candidatus Curtissbacteria bacterium]
MNPFDTVLINPTLNLLVAIYTFVHNLGAPGALGISIVILSAIIRLVLWPLTTSQLKSTKKMTDLKPHLDRIKVEHGHDKARHSQEVTKLYKEHGVSPLSSCLPLLIQLPFFFALFDVLNKILAFDKENFLININSRLYLPAIHLADKPDTSFLGLSLAAKPSDWSQAGLVLLLIPVITGLLQFVQSKMMAPPKAPHSLKKKEDKKEDMAETMAQVQSQMTYLMPVMFAFISYTFAIGLALYWNTFTIIGIIQQYIVAGPGSLNKYLPKKLQKN